MRVTVAGAGYVGLVTGVGLAHYGHQVSVVDVVRERVDQINHGLPPFFEPRLEEFLGAGLKSGRFRADLDLRRAVAESDVTLVAVGTPTRDNAIDLRFVENCAQTIGGALKGLGHYHVVVVKSTVVPGTTGSLVRRVLEETSGRRVGEFGLCVNPEFLREGSAVDDFLDPDRIVIGQADERAGHVLGELYNGFTCPKLVTTLSNAEMIKYSSNALLATLVSFSNELSAICAATPGADVEAVMDGLHLDRRLSPRLDGRHVRPGILSYLRAGCGFGGSCLPKDVKALAAYARGLGISPALLQAVLKVNDDSSARLVELAEQELGALAGRTVAILGLAFKAGTADLRDSPALAVASRLQSRGCSVRGYDPLVQRGDGELLPETIDLCDSAEEAVTGGDGAIICTACPEFAGWDWPALARRMRRPLLIDGRHALRDVPLPASIIYRAIGRETHAALRPV